MDILYKRLSELPVTVVSDLWNASFEGYMVNASMPLERFLARVTNDELCLKRSLACYVDGQPAGIILNSFRELEGITIARNGGTAIGPDHRGKGLGKTMMEYNLALYKEEQVKRAYLEAISTNAPAIRLYESVGYSIVDRLLIMTCEQLRLDDGGSGRSAYSVVRGHAAEVLAIPYYSSGVVWQSDVPNLKDAECVKVYDGDEQVGYGLFKRTFDDKGVLAGITLFRCEAAPGRRDAGDVIRAALYAILQPKDRCRRTAFNIRATQEELVRILQEIGFTGSMEQVLMLWEPEI
ncbi:N-acetyltransferase [Paenibacillus sp. 7541]|uniref:GNAT family N-acetyltransferase n=1 Tax=Paenibacillus sp. 7541 TaxID=2026236 RepID=UPI000BA73AEE|nr:N-acetyltransferase [Paenibacillus sp. 7541]PAK54486.1 GNAT family N-acetyltransferase [Paenibacillus sp. 7541]